jgi:AbrB family looped-hinge helix DNA binding protein
MLITIDKRGSINLPIDIRKNLDLEAGSSLDLEIGDGGSIILYPVSIVRNIKLNDKGLSKLYEARKSGKGELPNWMKEDIKNAKSGSQ